MGFPLPTASVGKRVCLAFTEYSPRLNGLSNNRVLSDSESISVFEKLWLVLWNWKCRRFLSFTLGAVARKCHAASPFSTSHSAPQNQLDSFQFLFSIFFCHWKCTQTLASFRYHTEREKLLEKCPPQRKWKQLNGVWWQMAANVNHSYFIRCRLAGKMSV